MSDEELKEHLNPHTFLDAPIDFFEAAAEPLPPGTKAPPRPPAKERDSIPQLQPEVAALIARIESSLDVIHSAIAEIKRLQNLPPAPPQSKAG